MATISQFTDYLSDLLPQKNSARLALFNYFKNFFEPQMGLSKVVIESFYHQALFYTYWQENADTLGKTIASDLHAFSTLCSLDFDIQEIQHSHQTQVIPINLSENFKTFLKNHLEKKNKNHSKISLLSSEEAGLLSLTLRTDGSLKVQSFPQLALLKQGELYPLGPRMVLEYTPQMELSTKTEHMIANTFNGFFRFRIQDFRVLGAQISGYTFNKTDLLKGPLSQTPELFYALKKIERNFINPQSDPFYHELVALLEKTIQLIKAKHPDAELFANQGLKKGQMALKNAFPNDRLLLLLTSQIESLLRPSSSLDSPR